MHGPGHLSPVTLCLLPFTPPTQTFVVLFKFSLQACSNLLLGTPVKKDVLVAGSHTPFRSLNKSHFLRVTVSEPHLKPLHPRHILNTSPCVVFLSPLAIFLLHLFVFCLFALLFKLHELGSLFCSLLYPQHLDQFLVLSRWLVIIGVKSVSSFMRR